MTSGTHRRGRRFGRCLGSTGGLVLSVGLGLSLRELTPHTWPLGTGAPPTVEDVLTGCALWTAIALCAWLTLGGILAALSVLPGAVGEACGRAAEKVTPTLVRKLVAVLAGTAVGTVALPVGAATGQVLTARTSVSDGTAQGASGQALAPDGPGTGPAPSPEFQALAVDPSPAFRPVVAEGWRPAPPPRVNHPESSRLLVPEPRAGAVPGQAVTVRRGDTLWSIAARWLGPEAADVEIAHEWPRWYAANRPAIGSDPDRLLPGTQLVPPSTRAAR